MIVYRICKEDFKLDLSGKGAELYGGRWNSKGISMLYTSQSRALAFAEIAIHVPPGIFPKNYFLVSIEIPVRIKILKLENNRIPTDWRSYPHSESTQNIGDDFVAASKYLVLQVPSAVVPGDFNFLINTRHPLMNTISIISSEPFEFDSRFVKG